MAVSIKTALRGSVDSIAKERQAAAAAIAAATDLWHRANATDEGDYETFQNRMCVPSVTAMDAIIAAGYSGEMFDTWFNLFSTYARADLGLSGPNYIESYFKSVGDRVPYEFAQAMVDAFGEGRRPDTAWIYPKGTYATTGSLAAAGLHKFGTLTGTSGDSTYAEDAGAIDTDKMVGAVILCQTVDATPNGTPLMSCSLQGTGDPKQITVTPSASANGQVVVGEEAITGRTSATVLTVAATAQFEVGEWVLLWENADGATSIREPAQIKAIVEDTSLEFESAVVNTLSSSGYVIPMFTDIAFVSGNIDNSKHLDFYAKPDRIIAL